MQDTTSKRNTKIFLYMSEYIGKTPTQCRSHHQKVKVLRSFTEKLLKNLIVPLNQIFKMMTKIKTL